MSDYQDSNALELNVYLAEYNALTTRATYFLNIQNVLLTALVTWVGIMVGIFFSSDRPNSLIIWGIILGGLILGISSAWLFYEEHNIVLYIEEKLRPKIKEIIQKNTFWEYESFLLAQRKKGYLHFEYSPFTFTAAVFFLVSGYRFHYYPIQAKDVIGFIVDLFFLGMLFYRTTEAVKIQKKAWGSIINTKNKLTTSQ